MTPARVALLGCLVALAACAAGAPASATAEASVFSFGPPEAAQELPGGGAVVDGVPYRFSLGHCGLGSPVEADGSFWDAVRGVAADGRPVDLDADADGEMINATSGVLIVIGDQAFFRTESGTVVTFVRHDGPKALPACD